MATTNTNKGQTMNAAKVKSMLAGNTAALVDLNDWAVNTARQHAYSRGYDVLEMVQAEQTKVSGLGLDEYLKVSRVGSHFCLNRKVRLAVWAVFATRALLG